MHRCLALTLFVVASLLTAPHSHGGTSAGDLLWQDQFDLAGGQDFANAVAAKKGRVVVVGSALNQAGNTDFIVRAYEIKSGSVMWEDRLDLAGGDDKATAVVMDDQLVAVAGRGADATGNSQLIVRAYVAETGALAWEDRSPAVDVRGLDMKGAHIVVTGTVIDAMGFPLLLVRTYVTTNGALAWEDRSLSLEQFPLSPGQSFDSPHSGVALRRGKVYVTRSIRIRPEDLPNCLVRSYDVKTGRLLWESIHTSFCFPLAIATDDKRVLVAGRGGVGVDDFLVQSYDADTGKFLWEDRTFVTTAFGNAAIAVDIEARRAFVVGWVRWVPGTQNQEAFLVRAYDTETGVLYWEDQFPSENLCLCHARDVAVDRGRVFAVGGAGQGVWFVRAYEAKRGDLLWHDEFLGAGAAAVATVGGKVFVAGSGTNAAGDADLIVRAYDAQ